MHSAPIPSKQSLHNEGEGPCLVTEKNSARSSRHAERKHGELQQARRKTCSGRCVQVDHQAKRRGVKVRGRPIRENERRSERDASDSQQRASSITVVMAIGLLCTECVEKCVRE